MSGHLLVSVSTFFADTRQDVASLVSELESRSVPVTLLVAPHIGTWHLAKDKKSRRYLEERRDAGTSLVLNGFDQAVQGRRAEFATLNGHEARLRLKGATRQMAKLGFEFDIFAPPRWQLSRGTLEVLPEFGFHTACSSKGLHSVADGGFISGRTLSLGEGFGAPAWWRAAVIRSAERGAAKGNLVRLSISGRNLAQPKTRRDFLRAVRAAVEQGAQPLDYRSYTALTG